MTDPVFTTRAELEKWAVERAGEILIQPFSPMALERAVHGLDRVLLAHSHLLEGNDDD